MILPAAPRLLPTGCLAVALLLLGGCGHRLSPAEAALANDFQCRGYGFEPGGVRYTQCRATLDERRAIEAARRPGSGDPTGLPIYLPPPQLPSPEEQGCMTVPINRQLYTNCP